MTDLVSHHHHIGEKIEDRWPQLSGNVAAGSSVGIRRAPVACRTFSNDCSTNFAVFSFLAKEVQKGDIATISTMSPYHFTVHTPEKAAQAQGRVPINTNHLLAPYRPCQLIA